MEDFRKTPSNIASVPNRQTYHEDQYMSRVMFEEVKQISAEMKVIVNRSEQEGRRMNKEEQEA